MRLLKKAGALKTSKSRSRSKSTSALKQKTSLKKFGNNNGYSSQVQIKNSNNKNSNNKSNVSFGNKQSIIGQNLKQTILGPHQTYALLDPQLVDQRTRQNEFFSRTLSKTSNDHPCYNINIPVDSKLNHYIQTVSTFFKEPQSEMTVTPKKNKSVTLKSKKSRNSKLTKKNLIKSKSKKKSKKSKSRSRSRSRSLIHQTSKSDSNLIQIPQIWQQGSSNGHISLSLPGGGSILLNRDSRDPNRLYSQNQTLVSFDNEDQQFQDQKFSCYRTQHLPDQNSQTSLNFENYQRPENRAYLPRSNQHILINSGQSISSENSDIEFLRQSNQKVKRTFNRAYPVMSTKKSRQSTSENFPQQFMNSWEHFSKPQHVNPDNQKISSEKIQDEVFEMRARQENRFSLLKQQLKKSLVDVKETKERLQNNGEPFKIQIEKISKRVENILIDQQAREITKIKDAQLKMQFEKQRINRIIQNQSELQNHSIDPTFRMNDILTRSVLSEPKSAKSIKQKKVKSKSKSKSRSRSRIDSMDSKTCGKKTKKSARNGKKSARSKKNTSVIVRKKSAVFLTQGANSKNSTIVHQCEPSASACSARPISIPQSIPQMTYRQEWTPNIYGDGGSMQLVEQPSASAGRKLRFQDMTPPQGTGLFADIGSALRVSSKASFGGDRKSILKNSGKKKREGQTMSLDSIEVPKVRHICSSSESENSEYTLKKRNLKNMKWDKLNIDKKRF